MSEKKMLPGDRIIKGAAEAAAFTGYKPGWVFQLVMARQKRAQASFPGKRTDRMAPVRPSQNAGRASGRKAADALRTRGASESDPRL
jgi:hypothetical protein